MGVGSYSRRTVRDQRQETGKRTSDGRQAAMASRNRDSADEEQSMENAGRERASGFSGWLRGLFAEDIIFWFHDTKIKGKSGRQVKGGAVPLFDGVILDLTPASMVGEADGDRQVVRPLEGGAPAKLIVRPAGGGFTAEHTINNFVITAPKNGRADGFSAEITERITYDLGAGVQLQAENAAIGDGLMVLGGARLVNAQGNGEIGGAVINADGIVITPKSDSESSAIEDKVQEAAEHGKDANQSLESQVSEARALEGEISESKAAQSVGSETEPTESRPSEDPAPGNQPSKDKVSEERPSADEEDAVEKQGGEDSGGDDEDDGLNVTINRSELAVSVKKDGNTYAVNGKERSIDVQQGDLSSNVNFEQKTFKISWGKDWSSEDEDEGEDEDQEEKKKEETNVKEAIQDYYGKIQESGREVLDKTGFARDALITFLKTGTLPENKYEKEEEENKTEVTLADVMIIPGISFAASLAPLWSFGFHFDFELEKEEMPDIEVTVVDGNVTGISCPDIRRILSLSAEVKGEIGATLRLALELGAGYIFSASGGLTATGKAQGIVDQSEKVFGRGKVQIPLIISGKTIKAENASLDLQAGIGITGSIGADLSIGSKLFGWEKELWSYTFKEWNPANLSGNLKMKQSGSGEKGLLSPHSWQLEEKNFSFELFKKKIEGSEKYGIGMVQESEKAKLLMDQGKQVTEKIQELHEKLKGMQEEIAKGGGQFGTEGNEAYENLMSELKGISAYLNVMASIGGQDYNALVEELDQLENGEEYQSSSKKVDEKIAKHSERYAEMKKWGEGEVFQGKEGERDKQAYSYYRETFHARNAERQREDAREESAKRRLATRQRLITYEEARIVSLGRDYDKRIEELEKRMGGMSENERKQLNPDFLASYKLMNEGGLFEKWQQYAGKERIINYETQRRDQYKKKHTERYDQLMEKKTELKISDTKAPNREFVDFYYGKMKARRFFSEKELLHNHQNGKEIVAYEEMRLEEKSKDYLERIEELEKFKQAYEETQDEGKRKEILANARGYYHTVKGDLGKTLQWHTNTAKAASKEEILAYETRKADIQENKKPSDDYQIVKKAVEVINKEGEGKLAESGLNLPKINSICLTWLRKNLNDKILAEIVPLGVLHQFEQQKIDGIRTKTWNSLWFMQKDKKEKTFDEKINNNKEYADRKQRLDEMNNIYSDIQKLQGRDKESQEQDYKAKYLNLYFNIDDEEGKKDRKLLMDRLRQGESLLNSEMRKVVLERMLEEYGGAHKERVEKLRKLMEPQEGQPAATDAQIWEEYRNMGGGRGFADYYVKEKGGNFTIDDMLRYERYEARAHSGKNAAKAFVQNTVTEKVSGEEKAEETKELAKGGHYDRYKRLKEELDNNAPDEKIAELYLQLGGGAGYTKWLMSEDRFLEAVKPQEILDYEQSWSGEKGQKHDDRLEKLQGLDSGLSDEEFYHKYREMVLEESVGKGLLDKVMGYDIGFDESVRAEDVLTPQIILKHEKKLRDETVKKHSDRLERLKQDDVTDENALEIYRQGGGGRGFFDHESAALSQTQLMMGASADFQNILVYEQKRLERYQKAKEELDAPLERIRESQKELKQQLEQAKTDIADIGEMWDRFHVPGNQAYKSRDGFHELVDVGTGAGVQAKTGGGIAQVQKVSETVTELKEHEFKQAQNAQVELMLIDEEELDMEQGIV